MPRHCFGAVSFRDYWLWIVDRFSKQRTIETIFSGAIAGKKHNALHVAILHKDVIGCPLHYIWPKKRFHLSDKSILEEQKTYLMSLVTSIFYALGIIGHCESYTSLYVKNGLGAKLIIKNSKCWMYSKL